VPLPKHHYPRDKSQRLKAQQAALQADWDLRHQKITALRQALVIETSAAIKFQLDQQIQAEATELARLEHELSTVESALLGEGLSPTELPSAQFSPAPVTTIHIAGDYIAGDKVQGDKMAGNKTEFPNATTVKIFEQVDHYHESPPPDPPS
jgi:hypothetical protein